VKVVAHVALLLTLCTATLAAQRGQSPRAAAPVDLTGYWVTVVTEDWRYRMVTPARGDHPSVPLNAAGNTIANTWDAAKDEAAGEQCRAYGAAGVMRLPGRIRITWQDDSTLKIETEEGTQTRLLKLGSTPADVKESWQGESAAQWEFAGGGRAGRGAVAPRPAGGDLKVVTTKMRPGYLQKNGVPYSASAVLTEYFSRTIEPNGDSWLILTSIVEDPQYLTGPFIRSTHYKRLPDNNTAWEAEPCSAR
jgi:ABC-type transport system substrate-binding protein